MAKKYDIIFYKSYSVTDIEADNEDDALEYAESVIPKEFKYYDDFDVIGPYDYYDGTEVWK